MFTHKNLMTVCCAAVLAFGLAACGGSSDGDDMPAVTDDAGGTRTCEKPAAGRSHGVTMGQRQPFPDGKSATDGSGGHDVVEAIKTMPPRATFSEWSGLGCRTSEMRRWADARSRLVDDAMTCHDDHRQTVAHRVAVVAERSGPGAPSYVARRSNADGDDPCTTDRDEMAPRSEGRPSVRAGVHPAGGGPAGDADAGARSRSMGDDAPTS